MNATDRALAIIAAVMHQPPPTPNEQRLLRYIAELLAENRLLRLARHTNGPAANGAVVQPEEGVNER